MARPVSLAVQIFVNMNSSTSLEKEPLGESGSGIAERNQTDRLIARSTKQGLRRIPKLWP